MGIYNAAACKKHVQTQDIQLFGASRAARSFDGHAANRMDCVLALHTLPTMATLAIAAPYTPQHAVLTEREVQVLSHQSCPKCESLEGSWPSKGSKI